MSSITEKACALISAMEDYYRIENQVKDDEIFRLAKLCESLGRENQRLKEALAEANRR